MTGQGEGDEDEGKSGRKKKKQKKGNNRVKEVKLSFDLFVGCPLDIITEVGALSFLRSSCKRGLALTTRLCSDL